MAAAKKELGAGVVVLNTRNVMRKGMFAALRSRLTEVTAAIEDENERTAPPRRETPPEPVRKTIPALKESAVSGNIEEKLDSLQNLLVSQFQKAESEAAQPRAENAAAARAETPRAGSEEGKKPEKESESVKFMKLLYNTMIGNEVDEKYANQIMEDIDKLNKPNMPFDYTLANTYQKLILKFGKTTCILPPQSGPKVLIFIGPTGVGKTTTIAKLSSRLTVEERKKVALVTADTYRIAAAEQLRTYANILEAPFRVIYTEEELQAAIRDFKSFDYIFVDTAGHSHQNEEQLEKMKSFLRCVQELAERQVFLILSATTKLRDLLRIADNYKKMTDFQLIFTKLDETDYVGNLLNVRLHTEAPISYITKGQNVPEDIEPFNPQKIVKQLLGGKP